MKKTIDFMIENVSLLELNNICNFYGLELNLEGESITLLEVETDGN